MQDVDICHFQSGPECTYITVLSVWVQERVAILELCNSPTKKIIWLWILSKIWGETPEALNDSLIALCVEPNTTAM